MDTPTQLPGGRRRLESAHVCPGCGHVLNLADIDLKTITTGIVECMNCDWSGPIEIQIVEDARHD
jgi:hypothetical protein